MNLQSNVAIDNGGYTPYGLPLPHKGAIAHPLTALICMEQALLGAGAIILAAIFAVTSFGGDGPSSSKRAPPLQQVAFWPCQHLRQWCVKSPCPAVFSSVIASLFMRTVGVACILHCCCFALVSSPATVVSICPGSADAGTLYVTDIWCAGTEAWG